MLANRQLTLSKIDSYVSPDRLRPDTEKSPVLNLNECWGGRGGSNENGACRLVVSAGPKDYGMAKHNGHSTLPSPGLRSQHKRTSS